MGREHMSSRTTGRKTTGLSIALTPKDRALLDKAAGILELPPSVWGRAELLKVAAKIVSDSKAAK